MERRKNIIVLSGIDVSMIERETERFLSAFRERQDGQSIDQYRVDESLDWKRIIQDSQSMGLFAEKRLFVFRGDMRKKKRGGPTEESTAEKELLTLCQGIPDDTFILFSGVEMDTGSSLEKWITTHADIRTFDTLWDEKNWKTRYCELAPEVISSVLSVYKKGITRDTDLTPISHLIAQSLEKLSLIQSSRMISKTDIELSVYGESGAVIFDLTESIMRGDGAGSLRNLGKLLEHEHIRAIAATLTSLLRTSAYVKMLQKDGIPLREITEILAAKPYPIEKAYQSKISAEKIQKLYCKIIEVNTAYKSGKGRQDTELGYIFDIQLVLLGLK